MPLLGCDPIFGYFHLIDTTKGKEELHQVLGRILGNLPDDRTYGICNGSVEEDRTHLYAGEIDTYLLAGS